MNHTFYPLVVAHLLFHKTSFITFESFSLYLSLLKILIHTIVVYNSKKKKILKFIKKNRRHNNDDNKRKAKKKKEKNYCYSQPFSIKYRQSFKEYLNKEIFWSTLFGEFILFFNHK